MAELFSTLSNIYFKQERFDEAEVLIRKSFEIRKKNLNREDPDMAQILSDYAKLLRKMNRPQEAEVMYKQSLAILSRLEQDSADSEDSQDSEAFD
jgi:tetratricopeptide (TPR) repeat protein